MRADLNLANPLMRKTVMDGLRQEGKDPQRPDAEQAILVRMPEGEVTGEPAYLIAALRFMLFEALTLLEKHKVGYDA